VAPISVFTEGFRVVRPKRFLQEVMPGLCIDRLSKFLYGPQDFRGKTALEFLSGPTQYCATSNWSSYLALTKEVEGIANIPSSDLALKNKAHFKTLEK
jgi:hypothetical protein